MRDSTPRSCSTSSGAVRNRWRMKLALRGAARVARHSCWPAALAAYGIEWARFTRVLDHRGAHCRHAGAAGRRLVRGAAAAGEGHRRAGRALPRGTRTVARRRRCSAPSRRASEPGSWPQDRRRWSAGWSNRRSSAARRSTRCAHRAPAAAALRRGAGGDRRSRLVALVGSVLHSCDNAVGPAARVSATSRPRRPTGSRSSRATPRCRRARTDSITAKLLGLRGRRRRRPWASGRRTARSSAMPLVHNDERHLRRDPVRRRRAGRVLRRGRRRASRRTTR